jgi:hypothetical protein
LLIAHFIFYHRPNRSCGDFVAYFGFDSGSVVLVKLDGVVFKDESVCTLLGWLVGGVRATSA